MSRVQLVLNVDDIDEAVRPASWVQGAIPADTGTTARCCGA